MYRVLMPVDDDEDRAMSQAEFVAGLPEAADTVAVTVVHAFHGEEQEAPRDMRRADRVGSVRRALAYFEEHGVDAEATDIGSPPGETIGKFADDIEADLIVVGGRKRSPAGKAVFGSVTQSVILTVDRPVAVTGGS